MAKKKGIVCDYTKLEEMIWNLAEAPIEQLGGELIDVEFVREAGNCYLRIYIDRQETPVDHQLCETVSNCLDTLLDQVDPIAESYYLEVSSPGLERPLKRSEDFQRFSGREVTVLLYSPLQGQKEYQGILVGLIDESIVIRTIAGEELHFPVVQVAKTHLTLSL